jgi:hypothetical protein
MEEREEESSDELYWRSFRKEREMMTFEKGEPLGRQAEKDHPVVRCGRDCVKGPPPKEELGCQAARWEETIRGCEAPMSIVRRLMLNVGQNWCGVPPRRRTGRRRQQGPKTGRGSRKVRGSCWWG